MNDAQMNAEYVAAAIQILAPQSKKDGKVFVIGHSQGNIVSTFNARSGELLIESSEYSMGSPVLAVTAQPRVWLLLVGR